MSITLRAVCIIVIATMELNHSDNAASVKWFGVDKPKNDILFRNIGINKNTFEISIFAEPFILLQIPKIKNKSDVHVNTSLY